MELDDSPRAPSSWNPPPGRVGDTHLPVTGWDFLYYSVCLVAVLAPTGRAKPCVFLSAPSDTETGRAPPRQASHRGAAQARTLRALRDAVCWASLGLGQTWGLLSQRPRTSARSALRLTPPGRFTGTVLHCPHSSTGEG